MLGVQAAGIFLGYLPEKRYEEKNRTKSVQGPWFGCLCRVYDSPVGREYSRLAAHLGSSLLSKRYFRCSQVPVEALQQKAAKATLSELDGFELRRHPDSNTCT